MSDPTGADSHSAFARLDTSNYATWKYDMQALLQTKMLWRLVSGQEESPGPEDKAELAVWQMKAERAAGLIYQSIDQSMQILVREHISDPVKMWNALKKLHEQDNPTARYLAYHSFLSIQKRENESLKQLTSRVERALHDVRNTRKAELTLDKFEEELACAVLCRTLPEEFSSFRSAVLLKPDFGW